ncbi:MAG: AAA family ATPase [Ilumatobacteraceae bacterium]
MAQGTDDVDASPPWFQLGRALLVRAAAAQNEAAPDVADDAAAACETARVAFHESLEGDDAFAVLAANARLRPDEAEVLAVLSTAEADMHCRRLVTTIHGDTHTDRLTLGALSLVFAGSHPGPLTLTYSGALQRSAFVDVGEAGPWTDHIVAVREDVIWSLLGDASPGPDLPIGVEYFDAAGHVVDAAPIETSDDLVVVTGPDRMRCRQVGARHAGSDRFVCVVAPLNDTEWAAVVREATITGRGIMVDIVDSVDTASRRWLDRSTHLVWVLLARTAPPIDQLPHRQWTEVVAAADEPTDEEWASTFGPDIDRTHRLTYDQMHRVQRTRAAVGGDIDAAVRRLASGPLEQLTRRIAPTRTWDDIVLSPARLALLQSVVDRYQHAHLVYDQWGFAATPSRGLVALFSGPSGTGKTLASEIIAGALGLDVFKLDLSSVVSKYIGETEKNLEQIFDAASAGNMVLFFDEADSLFGKRSEVRDARDRYANIEVSYLLQRLEAYDGLVVLATNFEKNVDEAFLRRIHVRVEFAMPGAPERLAIWETNLPSDAPVDGVDLEWLSNQFELSGASIRNAVVHAAFAAASAGTDITMEAAVRGVAAEFRKGGRLLKPKDFGEYFELVDPTG